MNGRVHWTLSDGTFELLVKKIVLFSCERTGSLYLLWVGVAAVRTASEERNLVWHIVRRNVEVVCVYTLAKPRFGI